MVCSSRTSQPPFFCTPPENQSVAQSVVGLVATDPTDNNAKPLLTSDELSAFLETRPEFDADESQRSALQLALLERPG